MDKFKLTTDFLEQYKTKKPPFGFNGLGELVYERTYSRIKEDGVNEQWWETVQRVVEGCYNMQKRHIEFNGLGWNPQKAQFSAQEMYDRMWSMKFLPPGRGLWAMGSALTEERERFESLNNCAYVTTKYIKTAGAEPFCFLMDASMLGVGVSFDTDGAGSLTIKQPGPSTDTYVITDDREGWVESIRLLINSYFRKGHIWLFDYSVIRPQGELIKGFGGIASGPEPLKQLHDNIRKVMDAEIGKSITKRLITDIMNFIGCCVVAGNLRRTALMAIDKDLDMDFLELKDYDINPERAAFGWSSNNSVALPLGSDYTIPAGFTEKNGEPGYIWLDNVKEFSRMNSAVGDFKDIKAEGVNPCLASWATVITRDGVIPINEIEVGSEIWSSEGWVKVINKQSSGLQKVFDYVTDDGVFSGTSNHKVISRGEKVEIGKTRLVDHIKSPFSDVGYPYNRDSEIVAIIPRGVVEVFDITVDNESHTFWCGGLNVSNCGEQSLESGEKSGEVCNLVELFPNRNVDLNDFKRTIKFAYLYAKTVTLGKTNWSDTNRILLRNRRIGCSMSGIAQFIASKGIHELRNWCEEGYKTLEYYDKTYSDWLCIPRSIKLSSLKPSGCRPWYALTSTTGGLLTLEELFEDHEDGSIWSDYKGYDAVNQVDTVNKIIKTYDNGEEDVYRINMNYGLRLDSTADHKWAVVGKMLNSTIHKMHSRKMDIPERWVATKDIQPNDIIDLKLGVHQVDKPYKFKLLNQFSIKMRKDCDVIKQPEEMNNDIAWFLGYLWGDGAMSPSSYRVRFIDDAKKNDNLYKIQKIAKEQFGIETTLLPASQGRYANILDIGSKFFWHWLIKNGVYKYFADSIDIIPKCVRASSTEHIISFIAGLIDSDGCSFLADGYGKFSLSTAYEHFAQHIQDVCWSVGIGIGCSYNTKGSNLQQTKSMFNLTASKHMTKLAHDVLLNNSNKLKSLLSNSSFKDWHWFNGNKNGVKIIGKVVSIENLGEMSTYDIEVSKDHWYYAGAAKSHNSVSLLAGATPGLHYPESRWYIRRMRLASKSPLVKPLIKAGYFVEPCFGQEDSTVVVSIPIELEDGVRTLTDVTMWEQLELAAFMQSHWSDNSVSATITFDPETEGKHIANALNFYQYRLKGISFLPRMAKGAFPQMPYEEITKELYDKMSADIKPLDFTKIKENKAEVERFCDGESCVI